MERYARGEEAAFGEVYDAIAPCVHAYLRRHCRVPARAEDLLQQAFLHLHRARGSFIPGAEVLPWALVIARRLLIDSVRHDRRHAGVECDPEAAPEPEARDPRADDLLAARETAARLDEALALLPATQRQAFDLVKREGLTFRQAAEMLGTTVPAVKLRAQRAYDALRAALGMAGRSSRGEDP